MPYRAQDVVLLPAPLTIRKKKSRLVRDHLFRRGLFLVSNKTDGAGLLKNSGAMNILHTAAKGIAKILISYEASFSRRVPAKLYGG